MENTFPVKIFMLENRDLKVRDAFFRRVFAELRAIAKNIILSKYCKK